MEVFKHHWKTGVCIWLLKIQFQNTRLLSDLRSYGYEKPRNREVRLHSLIKWAKVRALFAENKVRFARAEQLWLACSNYVLAVVAVVVVVVAWFLVCSQLRWTLLRRAGSEQQSSSCCLWPLYRSRSSNESLCRFVDDVRTFTVRRTSLRYNSYTPL